LNLIKGESLGIFSDDQE
jgi:hypothetical protein